MNDDSPDSPYISSASAEKLLGVSPRTIRNWVTAGKLSAISGKRGFLLRRADVIEFGKLSGHFSEEEEVGNASGNGSATSSGNHSPPPVDISTIDEARLQLETIRDTLLRPLIEQNERQQATITEQAEAVGRLTAERDALERRVRDLEAQSVQSPQSQPDAPQTATGEATDAPWWQFWRR